MSEEAISKRDLLDALGPCPSVEETAQFLRKHPAAIRRLLYSGELESLPGLGVIKISFASLLHYLNAGSPHAKHAPKTGAGRPKKARGVAKRAEAAQ
jgi:hypothetical protein